MNKFLILFLLMSLLLARDAACGKNYSHLGEIYFHSRSISSDNSISCASCHPKSKNFQDGYERALARQNVLTRNTPSLLNINRYNNFFWDGRATSLDEQINGPLFSRHELNSTEKILSDFTEATPELKIAWQESAMPITQFVQKALSDYMLKNVTTSTKFDAYILGKKSLTKIESRGWYLFSRKFDCISCHALPNFTNNKFYDNGIPKRRIVLEAIENSDVKGRYVLGFDYGRANISDAAEDLHAFRTPSLYNVSSTAPYMHNGIYQTIEEVLDFYSRNRNKVGKPAFTKSEIVALIAFMKTLDDSRLSAK